MQTIFTRQKIEADRDYVFKLMTEAPTASAWLWANRSKIDLEVGGEFAIHWLPETDDEDSTSGCHITALDPGSLLAVEWKGPTVFKPFGFMNAERPLTHVVFSLEGGKGACELRIIHSGFRNGDNWDVAAEYFRTAWAMWSTTLAEMATTEIDATRLDSPQLNLETVEIGKLRELSPVTALGPVIETQY